MCVCVCVCVCACARVHGVHDSDQSTAVQKLHKPTRPQKPDEGLDDIILRVHKLVDENLLQREHCDATHARPRARR